MAECGVRGERRSRPRLAESANRVRAELFRLTGCVGLLAAVCESWFLLAPGLGARLDPARAFVSELSVPGRPGSDLFRGADALAGVFVVAFAVGTRIWLGGRAGPGWRREAGCALLVAVGAFSVLDAARPMSCAPSADRACDQAERARPLLAQLSDVHTASGVAAALAAAAAMVLVGREAARCAGYPWLPGLSVGCSGALLLLGALIVALDAGHAPGVGVAERAQILLLSSWLAILAALIMGREPGTGSMRDSPRGGGTARPAHPPRVWSGAAP